MNQKKSISLAILVCCISLVSALVYAENTGQFNEEFLKGFIYRELGPARQCGRIGDIAVVSSQPHTFYISSGSGGLWKTTNNGTTFEPIFQYQCSNFVADIDVASSNSDIVWVGTGEASSGRLPLRGCGVFKSTDGGKTWTNMGLEDTHHIGKVVIHPQNPDIVYVAAVGFHFSFNPERGLYKTTDGGQTWEKTLNISEKVGVVDVALDPSNPDTIYAASYDRQRVPWHFEEGGPGSAIYKSTDAGNTWTKLAGGLPQGKIGRIGIAVYLRNPQILYANIQNSNMRPPTEKEAERDRSRSREPGDRKIGGEVYRSDDGGQTWKKMNSPEDSIGGSRWYSEMLIDPNDDMVIYVEDTYLYKSTDGGKTWGKEGPENAASGVHADHHALWINPENSKHIILGNDGGLAISYDGGDNWDVFDHLPLAQCYAIGVDLDEPYNIYAGLQDNGSIKIPSNSLYGQITRDDWVSVGGGDGMYNQIDPTDSRWLYNDYQNGNIQRVDQKTGIRKNIKPTRKKGEPPLRFNWNSPILISPHNSQVIYLGGNVLFRSLNRGDDWQEISPDLTINDPERNKGNIENGTITSIVESPLVPGLIWVGTDDGKLQLTRNGGATWKDLTHRLSVAGAPESYWVTRVFASNFAKGTAYVTKSGFQFDGYTPLVYKTQDFGETWVSITGDLPEGMVWVIVEDRKNPNLLFVGKEWAVFVTIDGGKHWVRMKNNMPASPIHDLVIHPRENDLVVGTHGRGIYVTDISPLQELDEDVLSQDAYMFEIRPKIQWTYKRRGRIYGQRQFIVPNEPSGLVINYYLKNQLDKQAKVTIKDAYGAELATLKGKAAAGINRVVWDMRKKLADEEQPSLQEEGIREAGQQGELVPPGEYRVILEVDQKRLERKAWIRKMPT